uniref:TEP1-F n=1 Tax=Anopheles funestus TaxID=62324 RepID=A0A4Y0BED1_ANOFN
MVNLPSNVNKRIFFKMPKDLSSGFYKIMIEGQRGFAFYKEATLVYLGKSESGLIQINKPAFKPGDTVQFRVIVLDTELKPPSRVKTVQVTIRDPQDKVVRTWHSAELYAGVFEKNLQIGRTPMLGMWSISVLVDGEVLESKTFEVKEYVLPSFDVEVVPTVIPLEEHQGLNLTITANYHVRKPVKGLAIVELYLEDDNLYQKTEFEMHGIVQVEMRFFRILERQDDQRDVRVKTTFIEQSSNHTVVKESQITVYKYMYSVELIKDISYFRPGLRFKCALQFRYHDGTPAKGITGEVEVMDIEYKTNATSDDEGLIKLELNPSDNIEEMYITFSNQDGFYFNERVDKVGGVTNAFIKLELNSPIKKNKLLQFWVTSNEQMTFFVYYVLSKGNIIDGGYISPNKQNKYPLRFKATEKMIPKAKVIVMTVLDETVLHDVLEINFDELQNKIKMSINKQEVKPGQEIEILVSGRPGAYIGLAAYDKDVLDFNQNHDLFWKDIMRVYNGFGLNVENEFDKFSSMGVFVTTLDDITFNEAHDMLAREGLYTDNPITKLALYRTNFAESWLWKNVTIGGSGTNKMIEVVPDTITSWYLTGFSIDPEYGLGIIKKPIEFTTILPSYIVENLLYSIKRGEVVELQFTLFNNLEREYNADVTLYNVFNQIEFVGHPLGDENCTKSVTVPPKVGVPISFLVKARSLGEITVRVGATIKSMEENDIREKVIQVLPGTLVQPEERFHIIPVIMQNNEDGSAYFNFVPQLDLRTYPDIQTIKEGRDGIFQCRDEGRLHARVSWVRGNGLPLPPGARNINGRLEIPNIENEYSGEYVCEAVDYSKSTPGSSMTVHLIVERMSRDKNQQSAAACSSNEATCMNGACIRKIQICDGISDCNDGADESSCSMYHRCKPNEFKCRNSKCVRKTWLCDGENDCGDGSDEENCATLPDAPCRYDEFQCRSGQCIPKAFQCDTHPDCRDKSDEIGCSPPSVIEPPPPSLTIPAGGILNITCRTAGVPVPLIAWRLNLGHVPLKCESHNDDGIGRLTCENMQPIDSGVYMCEIINTMGTHFVSPDTIVTVTDNGTVCQQDTFNNKTRFSADCIHCFCFGVSTTCGRANLYTHILKPSYWPGAIVDTVGPWSGYDRLMVVDGSRDYILRHLYDGVELIFPSLHDHSRSPHHVSYCSYLNNYMGNQLNSYGGSIRYEVQYKGIDETVHAPDVIIKGNGKVLVHWYKGTILKNVINHVSVSLLPNKWQHMDDTQATREDIMMVLSNIELFLIRMQYADKLPSAMKLMNVMMDSAAHDDRGLGSASLVEECSCPPGYRGLSCESCEQGYVRQISEPWLGRCVLPDVKAA